MRMALETAGSLDEVGNLFDTCSVVGAHGVVMSDLDENKAGLFELLPWFRKNAT